MDLSFFRRAWHDTSDRSPAALEYGVLVATLQAIQAASPTARAEARCRGSAIEPLQQDQRPLTALLLGQPEWPAAIALQNGSFNRSVARTRVNLR
jgi:hypothetical protein